MAATHLGRWWRRLAEFQTEHQKWGGKATEFECGLVVGTRQTGLSVYWHFSHWHKHLWGLHRKAWKRKRKSIQLCGQKCLVDARGYQRTGSLVGEDRKGKSNSNNHWFQPRSAHRSNLEEVPQVPNTSKVYLRKWRERVCHRVFVELESLSIEEGRVELQHIRCWYFTPLTSRRQKCVLATCNENFHICNLPKALEHSFNLVLIARCASVTRI